MPPAIKCDRCGKFEEGIGVRIREQGDEAQQAIREKCLCELCYNSFKEWWNNPQLDDKLDNDMETKSALPGEGPSC